MSNKTTIIPIVQVSITIDGERKEYITQNNYTEDTISKDLMFIKDYYRKEEFDMAEVVSIEITKPRFMSWIVKEHEEC